jgi:hypothetical protein
MTSITARDITRAVRVLFPAIRPLATRASDDGTYSVTMPKAAAWHWGVDDDLGQRRAELFLTGQLGKQVSIAGVSVSRPGARRTLAEILIRPGDPRREAVGRELADAGYDEAAVAAVLDEAARFPGRWAYTANRRRAVVKNMPAARWQVAGTAATEARIAALARGWRVAAPRPGVVA